MWKFKRPKKRNELEEELQSESRFSTKYSFENTIFKNVLLKPC